MLPEFLQIFWPNGLWEYSKGLQKFDLNLWPHPIFKDDNSNKNFQSSILKDISTIYMFLVIGIREKDF